MNVPLCTLSFRGFLGNCHQTSSIMPVFLLLCTSTWRILSVPAGIRCTCSPTDVPQPGASEFGAVCVCVMIERGVGVDE